MERPEGCKFWTHEDVTDWITLNVSNYRIAELGQKSSLDAALWWLAWESAEVYRESTMRELAEMVMDGLPPLDESDLTAECQTPHELEEGRPVGEARESIQDIDAATEKRLYDFFLGKR